MPLFASLALSATLAMGANPSPQDAVSGNPSAAQLDDIIVQGRRVEEAARAYIEAVGEPPRGTRLARWNKPLCISVTNMRVEYAQFVIDRIAANGLDAGADIQGPGCTPNVIVLATTDGKALAKKLVDEVGFGFRPAVNHSDLGRDALKEFQDSDAPVRWWNVTLPVTADTGDLAIALRGDSPAQVTVRDGSRLRSNIRYDMAWTIVIVDMTRTAGAPLGALADYVSMVSLAQVDPAADVTEHSTVLNLFSDPQSVAGLTSWDRDYLAALYAAPIDRANAHRQEEGVARSLIQQRRDREDMLSDNR